MILTKNHSKIARKAKENDMQKITVIIPVYNSGDTLHKCLNSVINQTYKNIEIITVYKPSSDNTLRVLKSFRDKRIKIIKQTEPTGPGGARNMGLDAASGDWLGFLEADDFIEPDFYEKLLDAAIKNNCDIAQGQMYKREKAVNNIQNIKIYTTPRQRYAMIKNGASFDKLFRTEIIRQNNIRFSECVRWEDNPFIFKSFFYGKLVTVPDARYFYNPSPWSEQYKEKLRADIPIVAKEIMDFIKTTNLKKSDITLVKRKMVKSFMKSFISEKNVYKQVFFILDKPVFLFMLYYRKKIKHFLKQIKRSIICQKKH